MPHYIQVALPLPFRETFTYRVEDNVQVASGCRVNVPFGQRSLVGVVVDTDPQNPFEHTDKIKDIQALLDAEPVFNDELMSLCRWAADYYLHPLGEVLAAALPQRYREGLPHELTRVFKHTVEGRGLPVDALKRARKQQAIHQYLLQYGWLDDDTAKQHGFSPATLKAMADKGLIEKMMIERENSTQTERILREQALDLNEEQSRAFGQIRFHHYQCYLLDGTTGSGKTELYLHIIARVLQSGKQALVMIPEIGLTPQTLSRFHSRFDVPIAELHSDVAAGDRARAWRRAMTGEARIVIGTRLASLTPFRKLGVIIIDEEHDRSYKQQDGFKYSARDISVFRAHRLNIPIILGSATPSLESLHNVQTGKYHRLALANRAGQAQKPQIDVIDLKGQELVAGLTHAALTQLQATIDKNEQALVFVNRRGYAPSLICHHCGWSSDCRRCDSKMTLHRQPQQLICHYCDMRSGVPRRCPNCQSTDLQAAGLGTEQLEHVLKHEVPGVEITRIDRDSTRNKHSMRDKLAMAREDKACIIIGTQMLAKGHHLPNLTLVIVVDADQGLLSSDFRALEQMGQLITQVAGRAGRANKPGRVLVQSYRPEQPLLHTLLHRGFHAFAGELLQQRQRTDLPPYWQLASFRAESKRMENNMQFLNKVKGILASQSAGNPSIVILGPHPAAIEKVNERFRCYLQVKGRVRTQLQQILNSALGEIEKLAEAKRTRWSLEVDSFNTI